MSHHRVSQLPTKTARSNDDTQNVTSGTSSSGLSTTQVIKWANGAFLLFFFKKTKQKNKTCWNGSNMTTWEAKKKMLYQDDSDLKHETLEERKKKEFIK